MVELGICNGDYASEVARYLSASFGDRQRIDYGTGHELNFICFLFVTFELFNNYSLGCA